MKKIFLLLATVLLLFCMAIYFGNLAGNPEAKRVIIYFRDLAGVKVVEETTNSENVNEKIPATYTQIGLVNSWRNLASGGFSDLLQLVATPDVRTAWQINAGVFLGDVLYSDAFFSSSWCFWQVRQEKLSLIGYYQPWLDVLLIIQVTEINGRYQATAIGISEPNTTATPISVTAIAQGLTSQLQRAEQNFQAAIDNPNAVATTLKPETVKKSQDILNQYVAELRAKLVANSVNKPISSAILVWLDAVRAGQFREGVLAQQSSAWLKQLQPVQLVQIDSEHWLLAAVDRNQAERVLIVQLQVKDNKAQATELQIWDAATAGGVQ